MKDNNEGNFNSSSAFNNNALNNLNMRKNLLEALSPLDIGGATRKNDNLNQLFKQNPLAASDINTPVELKNSHLGESITPRGQSNVGHSFFKNALLNSKQ